PVPLLTSHPPRASSTTSRITRDHRRNWVFNGAPKIERDCCRARPAWGLRLLEYEEQVDRSFVGDLGRDEFWGLDVEVRTLERHLPLDDDLVPRSQYLQRCGDLIGLAAEGEIPRDLNLADGAVLRHAAQIHRLGDAELRLRVVLRVQDRTADVDVALFHV